MYVAMLPSRSISGRFGSYKSPLASSTTTYLHFHILASSVDAITPLLTLPSPWHVTCSSRLKGLCFRLRDSNTPPFAQPHNMDTQPPELIDEEMASQDSTPISTPADAAPLGSAILDVKESITPAEPLPSASVATKHEYEDADATTEEDQRPAKRARTAEVASVSVTSHFYPASIATRFVLAAAVGLLPTCIVHHVLTALHSHAPPMLVSGAVVSNVMQTLSDFSYRCFCTCCSSGPCA